MSFIVTSRRIAEGTLKGLLSGTPFIGGLAIGAWDGFHEGRAEDFKNKLSERLTILGEKKVDIDYIKSEEFYDLLLRAFRSRTAHRSQIKARFILGLVMESVRNDRDCDFTTSIKESFLIILDQLSDEEMKLLYDFSKKKYNMSKEQFYEKGMGVEIDGLMSKGILTSGWDQRIKETALGQKFIDYMRILAKDSI